ncbi:MAG: HDOD domain-containing protein [Fibrobacterota bacterium]|nr:HDOD domain-containing protein [Fibrobacterota bacterium]QQS05687.1 MAG: HDOD domain-containing protein [Fibrobacterota bacterium]
MSLSVWLKRIVDKEMPAFRRTATDIRTAASNPETGSEALGKLILTDPALTARVLRIANTVFYNPSGKPIQTVSRGIVVLGVDAICTICVSLALIEALLGGRRQDRVMADLGRSIHAALVARTLAQTMREPLAEEVFIGALLYRVGNLVFWCFSEDEGAALDSALRPGSDGSATEKALLGFSLRQLTQALVEEWKLSNVLIEVFRNRTSTGPAECILLAWRWVQALDNGWETAQVRDEIVRLGERLQMDPAVVTSLMARLSREARDTAILFGSKACSQTITVAPCTPEQDAELFMRLSGIEADPSVVDVGSQPQAGKEDPIVCLDCLKRLSQAAQEGRMPELFPLILESLHKGMGFERVLFATLAPGDQVVGRIGSGWENPEEVQGFRFLLRRQMADSLSRAIEVGGVVEYVIGDPAVRSIRVPEELAMLKSRSFLFGVLQVGGRSLGAVFTDRGKSGAAFPETMRDAFRHMIQQGNLLLGQAMAVRAAQAKQSA